MLPQCPADSVGAAVQASRPKSSNMLSVLDPVRAAFAGCQPSCSGVHGAGRLLQHRHRLSVAPSPTDRPLAQSDGVVARSSRSSS